MQKNGWIWLHRKLWDNPRATDPDWIAVWIYILCYAAHEPTPVIWHGQRFMLEAGQLRTGRNKIARDTGVNPSKVKRILACLKSDQQIGQRTDSQCSLITVLNWERYQKSGQRNGQRMDTEQEDKKIKNKEEYREREKESKKERNGGASPPAHKAREFFSQYQEKGEGYTGLIHTIALKRNLPPEIVRAELDKFCLYWTEKNHSGTKTRWEMEKVFEVERRLTTWFSRAHGTQQKPVGVFIS